MKTEATGMSKEDTIDKQKLLCKLTDGEREQKTAELVRLEQEEAQQKAAKKASVSEMNAQLTQVRADIDQHVKELAEGAELREVEVEAKYLYDVKRVEYRRRDTGEVISSREMDSYDLQEDLPGEDLLPPPSKPQKRTRKKRGELTDVPDQTA
jgi:hypothetical protein